MCKCIRGNGNWNEHRREKQNDNKAKLGCVDIPVMKPVPLAENLIISSEGTKQLEKLMHTSGAPASLSESDHKEWLRLMGLAIINESLKHVGELGDEEVVRQTAEMTSIWSSMPRVAEGIMHGFSFLCMLWNEKNRKEIAKNIVLPAVRRLLAREDVQRSLTQLNEKDLFGAENAAEWAVTATLDRCVPVDCKLRSGLNPFSENEIVKALKKMSNAKKDGV